MPKIYIKLQVCVQLYLESRLALRMCDYITENNQETNRKQPGNNEETINGENYESI